MTTRILCARVVGKIGFPKSSQYSVFQQSTQHPDEPNLPEGAIKVNQEYSAVVIQDSEKHEGAVEITYFIKNDIGGQLTSFMIDMMG